MSAVEMPRVGDRVTVTIEGEVTYASGDIFSLGSQDLRCNDSLALVNHSREAEWPPRQGDVWEDIYSDRKAQRLITDLGYVIIACNSASRIGEVYTWGSPFEADNRDIFHRLISRAGVPV